MNKIIIEGTLTKIIFPKEYIQDKNIFIILEINNKNIIKGIALYYPSIGDYIIAHGIKDKLKIKIELPRDKDAQLKKLNKIYKDTFNDEYIKYIYNRCGNDIWNILDKKLLLDYLDKNDNYINIIYNKYNEYINKQCYKNEEKLISYLTEKNIKLNTKQVENLILYYHNIETIIETINENLVNLLEIESIGIKTILEIASSLNYTTDQQLELDIICNLYQPYNNNGDTCMWYNDLIVGNNKTIIDKLIEEEKIIKYKDFVYYKQFYNYEQNIARFLVETKKNELVLNQYYEEAKIYFRQLNFNQEQYNGIINLFQNNVNIITGRAGTGKSYILTNLIKYFTKFDNIGCLFLSPTGKACDRLNKDKNFSELKNKSYTMHKFIFYDTTSKSIIEFDNILNKHIKLFVIDEISMICIEIMNKFIKKIKKYKNIILLFVGDSNQLPSIGCGDILNQLIKSEYFIVTELIDIKRNNLLGLTNAQNNILNGQLPEIIDDSFLWIIENITKSLLDSIKNFNTLPLIFASTNKLIDENEIKIKEFYNPTKSKYIEINKITYNVNDYIMITHNNY